ncbi:MAG TPA: TetR/AcrR family transcriptional regulator [Mycobacteriales bacterium]|jgi:AcrR family transcriptional regulator|nr:TetR/AcrR family transcriptional regulator [Mycobacteriales bacterium]
MPDSAGPGRAAQRRRTRNAIIAATTELLRDDPSPSVDAIAAAADVSRRTIYTHFASLEQLLLDATVGAMSSAGIDAALGLDAGGDDVPARVDALARGLLAASDTALPMGRRIIRLTVETPPPNLPAGASRRGHRRTAWIEQAIEPWRERLSAEQFDRLVSALSMVIGWEAMVVLRDVRGLSGDDEEAVTRWAARSLVDAMLAEATQSPPHRPGRRRPSGG